MLVFRLASYDPCHQRICWAVTFSSCMDYICAAQHESVNGLDWKHKHKFRNGKTNPTEMASNNARLEWVVSGHVTHVHVDQPNCNLLTRLLHNLLLQQHLFRNVKPAMIVKSFTVITTEPTDLSNIFYVTLPLSLLARNNLFSSKFTRRLPSSFTRYFSGQDQPPAVWTKYTKNKRTH